MKQFVSIEKLDTGILYTLELVSSLSVLLLAFGLIASMANVLTKGSVLTDNIIMQRVWAWTQCVTIDASVAGTIIRMFRYHAEGERVKTWLYGLLSALLLFTAAIVSNIESVQQTLNITLDAAYIHVFIPVEVLIWIRSVAIVLLIVAHALRHVRTARQTEQEAQPIRQAAGLVITPELIEALRALLAQTTIVEGESEQHTLALPNGEQGANSAGEAVSTDDKKQATNNYERVKYYLIEHPGAKVREVARALSISISTASKWMVRVQSEQNRYLQNDQNTSAEQGS